MSAPASWDNASHKVAVLAAIRAYVRAHGKKRGLALAAEAIGMGERACRHAYDGGDFAADEERAHRADVARLDLLLAEINKLHAEAASITPRGLSLAYMARAVADRGRGMVRAAREKLLRPGKAGQVTP